VARGIALDGDGLIQSGTRLPYAKGAFSDNLSQELLFALRVPIQRTSSIGTCLLPAAAHVHREATQSMIEWEPITEAALRARIAQGRSAHEPVWEAIQTGPEKWQQHPYSDSGSGFWVVALIRRNAIWYNDIEEGFNRSGYSAFGTIDDYWCNQDELDLTVQYLMNTLEQGTDLVRPKKQPSKVSP
jgi:hypothetical protein